MSDDQISKGFLRRAARRVAIMMFTGMTLAGSVYVVSVGSNLLQARAEAAKPVGTAQPVPVQVRRIEYADGYTIPRRFIGQVETLQSTDLAFEFGGLVSEVLVDEGSTVTKGQPIARLDTALMEVELARLEASRDALSAQLNFSELSVQRREALQKDGFSTTEAFDQAKATRDQQAALLAETEAAIDRVRIELDKSTLFAPFDGRISARNVDEGATVSMGQQVVTLLQTGGAEVRVGLPVALDLAPQDTVTVNLGGQSVSGLVRTIRPDIDPQTRTKTAILDLETTALTYGQTVTVEVESHVAGEGAWVPLHALREGTKGLWTVLVVDEANIVRPAAVEILHTQTDRAFVRGSFAPNARLVETGPHRVTPGQTVRIAGEA